MIMPDKRFGLPSAGDVLAKLKRETSRIRKATGREDVADHCSNAAMTAWHLPEALWADIINDDFHLRAGLAKEAGAPGGKINQGPFIEFVRSDGECPELRYCRIIATETKHFGHETKDDDPSFTIIARRRSGNRYGKPISQDTASRLGLPPLDWMPIVEEGTPSWVYSVVSGEDKESAVDLFQRIVDYWERFMERHGIELN